jgi:hypothetical protein
MVKKEWYTQRILVGYFFIFLVKFSFCCCDEGQLLYIWVLDGSGRYDTNDTLIGVSHVIRMGKISLISRQVRTYTKYNRVQSLVS